MFTALLLLIAHGLSWVPIGAVVGHIERRGYSLVFYQIFSCAVCVASGLIGWTTSQEVFFPRSGCPSRTMVLVVSALVVCGVFDYLMFVFMGRAMKRGPNAIVWAIIQSGLIYPFLMGWLIFHVPAGPRRLCGIAMIVASIFFYASRGGASKQRDGASGMSLRAWLPAALFGMLCCGINQCCANLPSYLEGGKDFSGAFRTSVTHLALLLAGVAHLAIKHVRGDKSLLPPSGQIRTLAVYAVVMGIIAFLTGKYLAYPGLDKLQRLGVGSMGYPVMVASCIIGFFPYGLLVLRERIDLRQTIGAILGLAGILLGCC